MLILIGTQLVWGSVTSREKCAGFSQWKVYLLHSYIQLSYAGSLLHTDVSNLFTVLAFVAFKRTLHL
jgi:hypothetical protein